MYHEGWTATPDNDPGDLLSALASDGWTILEARYYRFVAGRPPPRPGSLLHQLGNDARAWPTLAWWALGILLLGLGLARGEWFTAALGVVWLGFYVRMLHIAADSQRNGRLAQGVVRSLIPHPLPIGCSTATARLPDGRTAVVGVKTGPTADLIQKYGEAEVLFVMAPDGKNGMGVAVRPPRACRGEGAGGDVAGERDA